MIENNKPENYVDEYCTDVKKTHCFNVNFKL